MKIRSGFVCEMGMRAAIIDARSAKLAPSTPHMDFFFNHTATTEIYTLSLHDALPIFWRPPPRLRGVRPPPKRARSTTSTCSGVVHRRSEEHTSELQSRFDLVCRL